jgi:hypothetical protein
MYKDWDLNIFFEEIWDEHVEEYVPDTVLSINPVLYTLENGTPNVHYTDIIIKTTFAEARYLRSEYPEAEYGYDWTDSMTNFLEVAPTRLKSLLGTLPDAGTVEISEIGGLRVLPTTDGKG